MQKNDILESELFETFASASDQVYVYVCDLKDDISRWSKNAVEYFELSGEYLEHAGEIWQEKIHPDDRAIYAEDIRKVFSGLSKHHSCQYRAMNRYGQYVWLECKGSVKEKRDGSGSIFAGMMTRLDTQNKYDELTGLMSVHEFYNRKLMFQKGALLLLGLDDFRKIIGTYGYNYGNKVLEEFAKNLEQLVSINGQVFRFSGDEFLICCGDESEEDVEARFEQILAMAERIGKISDHYISLSVSSGALFFSKEDNREEAIIRLEQALERAKQIQRGHVVFFTEEIAAVQKRINLLRADLRDSIVHDFRGFELHFQPIMNARKMEICGCEALLRWTGEVITDSYPAEFVKILEDSGDIIAVGKWVMQQAIRQQKEWTKKYGNIYMSFNISYQQFQEAGFVQRMVELVKEYEVEPRYIIAELTESCNIENTGDLARKFKYLRENGIQVALDDFGTGYASLEILKHLPANYIKIDQAFVLELAEQGHEIDYIIIENILSLGKRLDCKTVVEGVENEKVETIVKDMEPNYLQGYYYAKPMCKSEFESVLNQEIQE